MLQKFEQIRLSKTPIFKGYFNNAKDVFEQFYVSQEAQKSIEIIYADYECESYDGYATVFFFNSNTGKYYETYGSHCSCYGLEDQWSPEEIVFEELVKRFGYIFE